MDQCDARYERRGHESKESATAPESKGSAGARR